MLYAVALGRHTFELHQNTMPSHLRKSGQVDACHKHTEDALACPTVRELLTFLANPSTKQQERC
jgi:hypothetical protein